MQCMLQKYTVIDLRGLCLSPRLGGDSSAIAKPDGASASFRPNSPKPLWACNSPSSVQSAHG